MKNLMGEIQESQAPGDHRKISRQLMRDPKVKLTVLAIPTVTGAELETRFLKRFLIPVNPSLALPDLEIPVILSTDLGPASQWLWTDYQVSILGTRSSVSLGMIQTNLENLLDDELAKVLATTI